MGTRCAINFCYGDRVEGKIYRHWDGYPGEANKPDSGVLADLRQFFKTVKAQTRDTRFGDPTYLAAKFMVWAIMAPMFKQEADKAAGVKPPYGRDYPTTYIGDRYLDFLGYGIMLSDPGDLEYVYNVDCQNMDENGYPQVTVRSVRAYC